jgi:alpha-beta hydrolase superfamily lysophospholipase
MTSEFRSSNANSVKDFGSYLSLEDKLFEELEKEVINKTSESSNEVFNRYVKGSRSYSGRFARNWNRSYELPVEKPRGGVLLLHGLTDSPYSLHNIAELFKKEGFWVTGLRLPSHGTVPSALLDVKWEDWAAAVRIGAKHVVDRVGANMPFIIVGYSTGAPLAIDYSFSAINDPELKIPEGLILLSPAIGVAPVAALAKWQSCLSKVPGFGKLAWTSIEKEFDPFKYNSFTVNAGNQVYRLTNHVVTSLEEAVKQNGSGSFPRILAFQSAVDATVRTDSVINRLMNKLGPTGNELVLFDVNRKSGAVEIFKRGTGSVIQQVLEGGKKTFDVAVVTNVSEKSNNMQALIKKAESNAIIKQKLELKWPKGIYSLSHVALPFWTDDPLYGINPSELSDTVHLGSTELRGELGVLSISQNFLFRLRSNPFYPYIEDRIRSFIASTGQSTLN